MIVHESADCNRKSNDRNNRTFDPACFYAEVSRFASACSSTAARGAGSDLTAQKPEMAPEAIEWVAWYNYHRLMEPLGYIPPAEAEANYYRQLKIDAAEGALI